MDRNEVVTQAADATKWSTITEIAAKLIAPITNMALARILSPDAFGVVATVTIVVSFADMFTDAGFQKYLMQHDFADREELDANTNVAFWTNLGISLLLWLLICVFSEPIAKLVGNAGLGNVISIASISLPLTSFSSIQMARFRRDFDFKSLFYIRLISVCVPFFVTVPMALITRSFWALIVGTLVGNLVNAVVLTIRSSWKPKVYYRWSILKDMVSYSWWILLESIANWLSSYIGVFIVGMCLSSYYVGLYRTSMATVNQVLALITASTSTPLFVALSRLKHDPTSLMETYYDFICGLSIFLIPLGVGIWLYRDLITLILLGAQWTAAADFIGLWGLTSTIVLLLGTYCNGLYNAIGKTKLSFLSQVLHIAALVPVLLWGAFKGFNELCVARSLVRLELVVVQFLIMRIALKVSPWPAIKGLWPAVICTSIMTVTALLLKTLGQSLLWQIVSVLLCVVIYLTSCGCFYKKQLLHSLGVFGIKHGKNVDGDYQDR